MGCYVPFFCKVLFGSQIIHWKELIPAGIGKIPVFLAGSKYERKTIYLCISDV